MQSPHTYSINVRYRDLDPMGHVNNAVIATYIEEARSAYLEDVLEASFADVNAVLASISIDFISPITKGKEVY
ncbi:MAG: acyl-CoA thioesterase, partial [Halobacteriaceae archaeon]